MRIHEPKFEDDGSALFIVWAKAPSGQRTLLATHSLLAAKAAWPHLVDDYQRDHLTLQHGARILEEVIPQQS